MLFELIKLLFLFALGCVSGWVIEEIFYLVTERKLLNRGFLTGPYLPIYGFGTIALYYLSSMNISLGLKLTLFVLSTTTIEFLGGFFFDKYYHLKLWDYSTKFLNIGGYVCAEYSFYWLILSSLFYKSIFPLLDGIVIFINSHMEYAFYIGLFYGIFIVDLIATLNLANKIKVFVKDQQLKMQKRKENLIINFENFRQDITSKLKSLQEGNSLQRFFYPLGNLKNIDLIHILEDQKEKIKNQLSKKPKKI
ncbi:putative ABC transporter permease [Candidatus Woesearchaeota archaeon]|nr:putative ABC transporter permease [Candidatus Woesearchaeota archaeon]